MYLMVMCQCPVGSKLTSEEVVGSPVESNPCLSQPEITRKHTSL